MRFVFVHCCRHTNQRDELSATGRLHFDVVLCIDYYKNFVSDIFIVVLKRDIKLQLTTIVEFSHVFQMSCKDIIGSLFVFC